MWYKIVVVYLGWGVYREFVSRYECGFDSKDLSRMPFSLRFFFVVILFIILDVEVCLLLQLPYDYFLGLVGRRKRFFLFIFVLLVGLLVEVLVGLLNWKL